VDLLGIYAKEIIAVIVPFISWGISVISKSKVKLNVSNPHKYTNLVNKPLLDNDGNIIRPTQTINTSSYIVINEGKEKATNLELVFNWKPLGLNTWPVRKVTESSDNNKRHVLIFESLAPNERLGFELVDINNELPNLITVRCDQCTGVFVDMFPQPIVNETARKIGVVLAFSGLGAIIYLSILLIQYLVLKTPVVT
jgi:hypothetical protein